MCAAILHYGYIYLSLIVEWTITNTDRLWKTFLKNHHVFFYRAQLSDIFRWWVKGSSPIFVPPPRLLERKKPATFRTGHSWRAARPRSSTSWTRPSRPQPRAGCSGRRRFRSRPEKCTGAVSGKRGRLGCTGWSPGCRRTATPGTRFLEISGFGV